MTRVALIGGTGLDSLPGLQLRAEHRPQTPWGEVSHSIIEGRFAGCELMFLPRHGQPHRIPPHRINYRANIWALKQLQVEAIVAVNAVGAIGLTLHPGQIVIPDQLIDYTWGRRHSYYDDEAGAAGLQHIDFSEPYNNALRVGLVEAAEALDIDHVSSATYGVTQGPRLETAAEIRRMRGDGCDVVGMTAMPEAALAAEQGIAYASLCMVVNAAAGIAETPITLESMRDILAQQAQLIAELLAHFLHHLPPQEP